MEEMVARHYQRAVWLPADFRATLRTELAAATQADSRLPEETRERLTRRLEAIGRKETTSWT